MKLFVKFDFNSICKKVLEDQLNDMNLAYRITNFGEIDLSEPLSKENKNVLEKKLNEYGISIIENQKSALVQKIKDAIVELVNSEETINVKSSVYLSEKLGHSYGYISNIFSDVTFTSIENYIILQKIELAKQLLLIEQLSLTEIAGRLNYSSVAHLSSQFKNITGITPSQFQKIIAKRREKDLKN